MVLRFNRFLASCLVSILIILAVAGCGGTDPNGGTVSPLPKCDNNDLSPFNNFYTSIPNISYTIGTLEQMNPAGSDVNARIATALSMLIYETRKWSVQHDVPSEKGLYRFTITLITPELIFAVILVDYVYRGKPYSEIVSALDIWNKIMVPNNQIMFLMSVNSSNQGQNNQPDNDVIYSPIKDIALGTMSGLNTSQPDSEGVFNYNLDSYDAPIQYYFSFPAIVKDGETCMSLFDLQKDLSFTLGIKTVQIAGKPAPNLVWNFDLAPLLKANEPFVMPTFSQIETVTVQEVLSWPQDCSLPAAATKEGTMKLAGDHSYWIKFSDCIWRRITGNP